MREVIKTPSGRRKERLQREFKRIDIYELRMQNRSKAGLKTGL